MFKREKLSSYLGRPALEELARRPALSLALIALLALAGSAALSLGAGLPAPRTHDEFSYLLAADTFAHGRLSNPPHPLWMHFESMHIIQQPTYASKYPPAQGLMLALGQVVGGHPIVGAWISVALMCAALYWMLLAWLPPRWALLGGLLALVCLGVASYWSQSYWGGAVAALGGALAFGALPRILRRPRAGQALLFGLGLAILANSRPYEGLLASLPAGAVLLAWAVAGQNRPPLAVSLGRVFLPMAALLALTGLAMGLYNASVTGDALTMPYAVHEETYAVAPLFLWQPLRPQPAYRHEVLQAYYTGRHLSPYLAWRSLPELAQQASRKLSKFWRFYLGPALLLPLALLPWLLKNRWMALAALTCGLVLAGALASTTFFPHYAAPITGLLLALVVEAMRRLHVWQWRGRPAGRYIVLASLLVCLLAPVQALRQAADADSSAWQRQRARIVDQLEQSQERHLIIVRYGPNHHLDDEWVYNEADIDGAQVVWAREMDAAQNRKLLAYFQDRRHWLLAVDRDDAPQTLAPYAPLQSELVDDD